MNLKKKTDLNKKSETCLLIQQFIVCNRLNLRSVWKNHTVDLLPGSLLPLLMLPKSCQNPFEIYETYLRPQKFG